MNLHTDERKLIVLEKLLRNLSGAASDVGHVPVSRTQLREWADTIAANIDDDDKTEKVPQWFHALSSFLGFVLILLLAPAIFYFYIKYLAFWRPF